mmetsp:Transcript_105720/g.329507  ORF Transcript_105720/g.329507 Transcript_105720/m.329507 type:complete len:205 (-) Transcript_105720:419-1033(-)
MLDHQEHREFWFRSLRPGVAGQLLLAHLGHPVGGGENRTLSSCSSVWASERDGHELQWCGDPHDARHRALHGHRTDHRQEQRGLVPEARVVLRQPARALGPRRGLQEVDLAIPPGLQLPLGRVLGRRASRLGGHRGAPSPGLPPGHLRRGVHDLPGLLAAPVADHLPAARQCDGGRRQQEWQGQRPRRAQPGHKDVDCGRALGD